MFITNILLHMANLFNDIISVCNGRKSTTYANVYDFNFYIYNIYLTIINTDISNDN